MIITLRAYLEVFFYFFAIYNLLAGITLYPQTLRNFNFFCNCCFFFFEPGHINYICSSNVIDPKIPLTLALSHKGRGYSFISPPSRGGDEGEGVFSCSFVSQWLMSIPAKAGIQKKIKHWIPHQVRNDRLVSSLFMNLIL